MARERHLTRAPITEALLDIQVSHPDGLDGNAFSTAHTALSDAFPTMEVRHEMSASFNFDMLKQSMNTATNRRVSGVFFKSADQLDIVQMRIDGFTVNRLAPYLNWETLLAHARRHWDTYQSVAVPAIIRRVGVRYINRIVLEPEDVGQLHNVLTSPPIVPENALPKLNGFLSRLVLEDSANATTAIVTQSLEQEPEGRGLSVLLDIETFTARAAGVDPAELFACLEALRGTENKLFFGSLTETLVARYER